MSELCERRLVVALTSSVLVVVVVVVLERCRWRVGDVLLSACVVRVVRNGRIDCEYNSGLLCGAEVSLYPPSAMSSTLYRSIMEEMLTEHKAETMRHHHQGIERDR